VLRLLIIVRNRTIADELDLTRDPLVAPPPRAMFERFRMAKATSRACGHQQTTDFGKTHFFSN